MSFSRIVLVVAAVCAGASAGAQGAVHWYATIAEASEQAIPKGKPIMIEFFADWCAPCKVMEKEVFSTAAFEQAAKRFLSVRIDCEEKVAIARKYNVETLPTIIFADSYGNELFRHSAYLEARPLLELMQALPGEVSEFSRWNQILAVDKNNFEALEGMGRSLRAAGLFRASSEYYTRALQRHEGRSNLDKREAILNELGLNLLAVQAGNRAAATFERCLKEFPNSEKVTTWTLNLGEAYSLGDKNNREKARTLLRALMQSKLSGPERERGQKILEAIR